MEITNDKPIRMWPGTIILQSPPCSWDKCIFCGFSKDCLTSVQPSTREFLKQLDHYFDTYDDEEQIEIYNSGSFFDDEQISAESRVAIIRRLSDENIKGITIESRPEHITKEKLKSLTREFKGKLTVAIGLEIADDTILKKLNKGFTLEDVENAYCILDGMGISSRVYLLVGPPFVNDPKESALNSVRYAKKIGFTEMSLIGAYPMENTKGKRLWENGEWLPLKKADFDGIIRLILEIEPKVDYSSEGLEGFWGN